MTSFLRASRFAGCLALTLLAACSDKEETPYVERPAETIYNDAMNTLLARD